jgi:nucleotide-binding universal stress UspA family protein
MIQIKNVLVATDFSEPSRAALDYGRELARHYGATLRVVHIVEDILMSIGLEGYVGHVSDLQRESEDAAGRRVQALLTDRDRRELHAKGLVLSDRSTAHGIVDYARQEKVDLIVMGTHGRGGAGRLWLGSVAERVLRTASCPVLTVRYPEREFVKPGVAVASRSAA